MNNERTRRSANGFFCSELNNERTRGSWAAQMFERTANERTVERSHRRRRRAALVQIKKTLDLKKKTAPSTVRSLARDPRVLISWPLPLGFGLGGRLLLTGTAWAGLCLLIIHHNLHIKKKKRPNKTPMKTPNRETRAGIITFRFRPGLAIPRRCAP